MRDLNDLKMFKIISLFLLLVCLQISVQNSMKDDFFRTIENLFDQSIDNLDELLKNLNLDEHSWISLHKEPDLDFDAQQMIEYRGFKFEKHQVITEDCYILGKFTEFR